MVYKAIGIEHPSKLRINKHFNAFDYKIHSSQQYNFQTLLLSKSKWNAIQQSRFKNTAIIIQIKTKCVHAIVLFAAELKCK